MTKLGYTGPQERRMTECWQCHEDANCWRTPSGWECTGCEGRIAGLRADRSLTMPWALYEAANRKAHQHYLDVIEHQVQTDVLDWLPAYYERLNAA